MNNFTLNQMFNVDTSPNRNLLHNAHQVFSNDCVSDGLWSMHNCNIYECISSVLADNLCHYHHPLHRDRLDLRIGLEFHRVYR